MRAALRHALLMAGIATALGAIALPGAAAGHELGPLRAQPCGTITLSPQVLPDGTVGSAYSASVTASGGTPPYHYPIAGSIPPGLQWDQQAGAFSGTPTTPGAFSFTIGAVDNNGCTGSQNYTISIAQAPAVTIVLNPLTLPDATVGKPYAQKIDASGGTAPYSFTLTDGSLPGGITLGSGGLLGGTPTTPGGFSFRITATDNGGATGDRDYKLTVATAIVLGPVSLPGGRVGEGYSGLLGASGGTSPYTFVVTEGELPPGVTLSPHGVLEGKPTKGGSFKFTITATDADGHTGTREYTIRINPVSAAVLAKLREINRLLAAAIAGANSHTLTKIFLAHLGAQVRELKEAVIESVFPAVYGASFFTWFHELELLDLLLEDIQTPTTSSPFESNLDRLKGSWRPLLPPRTG